MPDDAHSSDPLLAYAKALRRRGYADAAVERRLRLAQRIFASLNPSDAAENAYRNAVERLLERLDNPAAQALVQKTAREFHPFYVDAGRPLPAQSHPLPPLPRIEARLPPHEGLDDLIRQALDAKFDRMDVTALVAYTAALKRAKIARPARHHRLALARLLLFALQGLPRSGRGYRAAIEALLPLFTREETRAYFLGVAREFHPHLFPSPPETRR